MNSLNVGLLKNKICPTNLISFCDRVGRLVERGSATDKMCLDFRKTFDRVSGDVLLGKMKIHELGDSYTWRTHGQLVVICKGHLGGRLRGSMYGPHFSTS